MQIRHCRTGIRLLALTQAEPQPAVGKALGSVNGKVKFPELLAEAAVRLISTLRHDRFVLLLCKCFKNNQGEKKMQVQGESTDKHSLKCCYRQTLEPEITSNVF